MSQEGKRNRCSLASQTIMTRSSTDLPVEDVSVCHNNLAGKARIVVGSQAAAGGRKVSTSDWTTGKDSRALPMPPPAR